MKKKENHHLVSDQATGVSASEEDMWMSTMSTTIVNMHQAFLAGMCTVILTFNSSSSVLNRSPANASRTPDLCVSMTLPVLNPIPTPVAWGSDFSANVAIGLDPSSETDIWIDMGAVGRHQIGSINPSDPLLLSNTDPILLPNVGVLTLTAKDMVNDVPNFAFFPGQCSASASIRTIKLSLSLSPDSALIQRLSGGEQLDASIVVPLSTPSVLPSETAAIVAELDQMGDSAISMGLDHYVEFGTGASMHNMPLPMFSTFTDGAVSFVHAMVDGDIATWRADSASRAAELEALVECARSVGAGNGAAAILDRAASTHIVGVSANSPLMITAPYVTPEAARGRFAGDRIEQVWPSVASLLAHDPTDDFCQIDRTRGGRIYWLDWLSNVLTTTDISQLNSLSSNASDVHEFDLHVAADERFMIEFIGDSVSDRIRVGVTDAASCPSAPANLTVPDDAMVGMRQRPELFRTDEDAAGFSIRPRTNPQTVRIAVAGGTPVRGRVLKWPSSETPDVHADAHIGLHSATPSTPASHELRLQFGVAVSEKSDGETVAEVTAQSSIGVYP